MKRIWLVQQWQKEATLWRQSSVSDKKKGVGAFGIKCSWLGDLILTQGFFFMGCYTNHNQSQLMLLNQNHPYFVFNYSRAVGCCEHCGATLQFVWNWHYASLGHHHSETKNKHGFLDLWGHHLSEPMLSQDLLYFTAMNIKWEETARWCFVIVWIGTKPTMMVHSSAEIGAWLCCIWLKKNCELCSCIIPSTTTYSAKVQDMGTFECHLCLMCGKYKDHQEWMSYSYCMWFNV